MAELTLTTPGDESRTYGEGSIVTFGRLKEMAVVLCDPRPDVEPANGPTIPRHVLTITVGKREVQVQHQPPGSQASARTGRHHAVFIAPGNGRRSTNVDYGCAVAIHDDGLIVIRDSPEAPRRSCWPDFHFAFKVRGVAVGRRPSERLFGVPAEPMTAEVGHEDGRPALELQPHEVDYVTALALPWLTDNPELWLAPGEAAEMWGLSAGAVDAAMNKLRDRMAGTEPPLWDPVHNRRAAVNIAAAAKLAKAGYVTLDDVERLNILGYLHRREPARRTEVRRSRARGKPQPGP